MENILYNVEVARINKQFRNGLSYFTQSHCQCSLTDNGYRIYRTPNKTISSDGHVMWEGLVISNTDNRFNLQKGHTYIIEFEVTGKSSNRASDICWSNKVGWGGGGLGPSPSNVIIGNPVIANFNSNEWHTFSYKFTINDDIYKVCTSSYSSFIKGNTYLSYNGFKFGFIYTNTGELGTDLYIKNIRMFDITSENNKYINKQGQNRFNHFIERNGIVNISQGGSIITNDIIEI